MVLNTDNQAKACRYGGHKMKRLTAARLFSLLCGGPALAQNAMDARGAASPLFGHLHRLHIGEQRVDLLRFEFPLWHARMGD